MPAEPGLMPDAGVPTSPEVSGGNDDGQRIEQSAKGIAIEGRVIGSPAFERRVFVNRDGIVRTNRHGLPTGE